MALLINDLRTGNHLLRRAGWLRHAVIALTLIAALCARTAAQDKKPEQKAKGETVTELDKAIWYVFQAKDNTYWFGSREHGVYRYDGKAITRYSTKDGLNGNRIGEFRKTKQGASTSLRIKASANSTDKPSPR